MRFDRRHHSEFQAGDMTPMIDMVFLLIAFFTVLINFSEAEQDQRIKLPSSELAIPPEVPPEHPITLQLTEEGPILFGGVEYELGTLPRQLDREKDYIMALPNADFRRATVILRADGRCPTGRVLEVIEVCKEVGFEKFKMRAKSQSARQAQAQTALEAGT